MTAAGVGVGVGVGGVLSVGARVEVAESQIEKLIPKSPANKKLPAMFTTIKTSPSPSLALGSGNN